MLRHLSDIINENKVDFYPGIVTVIEEERSSKVTYMNFKLQDHTIWSINKSALNDMNKFISSDNGKVYLSHECDGILICDYNGKKYLVIIELKSSYTVTNIKKARLQLQASYVKIMSILNMLDGCNIDDFECCCFIVSLEPDAETISHFRKRALLLGNKYCIEKFCLKLAKSKDKKVLLERKFSEIIKLKINSKLIFNILPIYHVSALDHVVDLAKYLK